MEKEFNFECIKCNNKNYSEGKISTTGGGLTKFLNIQNNKFITISCTECGFTEIFKAGKSGMLANIFDALSN